MKTQEIREHMEVVGSDGQHVGTVDYLEGQDRIILTRKDSPDGRHHAIPAEWVEHVDVAVHLNKPADEAISLFN